MTYAVLRVKPDKPLKAAKFGDSEKMRVGDWGGRGRQSIRVGRKRQRRHYFSVAIATSILGPYDNYFSNRRGDQQRQFRRPVVQHGGRGHRHQYGYSVALCGSIGIGFSTPSDTVIPVVEQLQKFGETRRGWLGVRIQNVDDSIAESLNLGTVRGALVAGTDEKGPAKAAGLLAGDVILKFDGVEIKESHDLPKIVASAPVGKDVDVVLLRQGERDHQDD